MYVCVYVFMHVFRGTGFEIIYGKLLSKMRVGEGGGLVTSSQTTILLFTSHKTNSVFDLGHMFG